ncbi:hypothetical protein N7474_001342 [Penicillium riverlandense]|uniref:uncharacterized protein n=1 Tax=Penicillium riverlandense TaxID=1903569 RepID=UPI0025466190|nr:uncharacterized protein N7474_001342 [Penicillium riverlandense]KAJ5833031.1 hypothetical protein N7474_001342 [Penicillium riverlandense]
MPSKGITVYTYISLEGYEVEFTVPKLAVRNTAADNFTSKNLEVESSNIPGLNHFTGRFEWNLLHHGAAIASAYCDINALTGKLEGGTMAATVDCKVIITDEAIITYGFYDAGHGEFGLTNRDQCYVTVCSTANRFWMGTVASPASAAAQKPFSRFVLAAPHDDGMNSMTSCDAVLQHLDGNMVAELRKIAPTLRYFDHLPDHMLLEKLPNIVYGLAITQKKNVPSMLALGARYFEFRPAKLVPLFQKLSVLPDKFYFQHACIPGLAFDEFLDQLVAFLDEFQTEIVTIHIRWDNIVKECQLPTEQEVQNLLTTACNKATRQGLAWGGSECFQRPIDELRNSGTRLICVVHADKYDSWTAEAYATLVAKPIIDRFESMHTAGQESSDLTVLQCQATSQSIKDVLVYSVLSAEAASSCLTSTKAALDMETLPWLQKNVLQRLQANKTIVIMNDFIDGATIDTSIKLSRQRLAA